MSQRICVLIAYHVLVQRLSSERITAIGVLQTPPRASTGSESIGWSWSWVELAETLSCSAALAD